MATKHSCLRTLWAKIERRKDRESTIILEPWRSMAVEAPGHERQYTGRSCMKGWLLVLCAVSALAVTRRAVAQEGYRDTCQMADLGFPGDWVVCNVDALPTECRKTDWGIDVVFGGYARPPRNCHLYISLPQGPVFHLALGALEPGHFEQCDGSRPPAPTAYASIMALFALAPGATRRLVCEAPDLRPMSEVTVDYKKGNGLCR